MKATRLVVVATLVFPAFAAEQPPRSGLTNPTVISAQGGFEASAEIAWQPDKQTKEPYRITSIQVRHPNYKAIIPAKLFHDLRWPSLTFEGKLYVSPADSNQLYLIIGGGDGGSLYQALFLITAERVSRIGPPHEVK